MSQDDKTGSDAALSARRRLLERARQGRGQNNSIPRREPDAVVPLSLDQERLWLVNQVHRGTSAHHVPAAYRLRGELNIDFLRAALSEIAERHESLRTAFQSSGGHTLQRIWPQVAVGLPMTDLSGESEAEVKLKAILDEEANEPFDLAKAPLMRARLVRMNPRDHVLSITLHHMVADGWSATVLVNELAAGYNAKMRGASTSLPQLPIQFADYVLWQHARAAGDALSDQIDYWKKALSGAAVENLPTDRPRPRTPGPEGATEPLVIAAELHASVKAYAQQRNTTPFVVLLAAFKIMLGIWSGQREILVGTPVAARTRPETLPLIGFLANTLVLRSQVDPSSEGEAFVEQVQKTVRSAFDHQELSLGKLVEVVERQDPGAPMFHAMFSVLPQNSAFTLDGVAVEKLDQELKATDFDLFFAMEEGESGLRGGVAFSPALFERETVRRLIASYAAVLSQLVARPRAPLSEAPIDATLAALARRSTDRKITVAICANFTADLIAPPLHHCMGAVGVKAEPRFAAYNQVFQELLSPQSLFARNGADGVNLVLLRLSDWLRQDERHGTTDDPEQMAVQLARAKDDFVAALSRAAEMSRAPFIVIICPESPVRRDNVGQRQILQAVETELVAQCSGIKGVYPSPANELHARYPVAEYYDAVTDKEGHIPYTAECFAALALLTTRLWHAVSRRPHKVIVLDCDNTLWSGVCAEDGVDGIRVEGARLALQTMLREQRNAGVLLCLCSKNEEADVLNVFERNRSMHLRIDDLVAWRINWSVKSENIRSLAQELGLGLDSFIFIDDNPVECAEVEANCPEVTVLPLPESEEAIDNFLRHLWIFDHLKVTAEDAERSRFYQQDVQRKSLMRQSLRFEDFLSALELRIDVGELDETRIERASQLTLRTNQFNATGIRRSVPELRAFMGRSENAVLAVQVRDRYGDYGFVGLVGLVASKAALVVETFLLSCRVLGRGVEHRMLAEVGRRAVDQGIDTVEVRFRATERNAPISAFLHSLPARHRIGEDETTTFVLAPADLTNLRFVPAAADLDPPPRESTPRRGDSASMTALMAKIINELSDARRVQEKLGELPRKRDGSVKSKRVPPATALEAQLLSVWEETLGLDGIGVTDNFFDLGGHSLLLVRMASRLQELLAREVSVITLFQYVTVRTLAEHLGNGSGSNFQASVSRGNRQRELLRRTRQNASSPRAGN